jgi:fimbrial isopeptide formation D2 family protein
MVPATAFAAGGIKIASTNINGQQFRAYQIFMVETNAAQNDGVATSFTYTLKDEYKSFETYYKTKMGFSGDLVDYIKTLSDESGNVLPAKHLELDSLARELWNWSEIPANKAVLETADLMWEKTAGAADVEFTGLPAGYYVVVGSGIFHNHTVPTQSFAALCTVLDGVVRNVRFKADAPKIEKHVKNHYNDQWEKWTDIDITAPVQFRLMSSIPDTSDYAQYFYAVHDNMSAGITYNSIASVTAIKDSPAATRVLNPGANSVMDTYVLSAPGKDRANVDTTFSVLVNSDTIKDLSAKGFDRIEIIVNATLNPLAVIEQNGNPNYVKLEYSNNPNWVGDGTPGQKPPTGETPNDDAWVYTYKLAIFKYTGIADPLPGVKFQLFASDGRVASFAPGEGINAGKNVFAGWVTNNPTSPAANTILVTGPLGTVEIVGLDAATYTLKELEGLPGYNPISDITVTVKNKLQAGRDIPALITHLNSVRGSNDSGASFLEYLTFLNDINKVTVDVYNGKGALFPGTGGMGVYVLYAISAIITAGLIAFFVINKKRNILKVK